MSNGYDEILRLLASVKVSLTYSYRISLFEKLSPVHRLDIDRSKLLLHLAELAQDLLLRGQHLAVRVVLP